MTVSRALVSICTILTASTAWAQQVDEQDPLIAHVNPITKGVTIRAGDFSFIPQIYLQTRWTFNVRDEPIPDANGNESQPFVSSLTVPRARARLQFNYANMLSFFFRVGVTAQGSFTLDLAYSDFHFTPNFTLRAGRFWNPLLWAEFSRAPQTQAVDYSGMANTYSAGSSQGLLLMWTSPKWGINLAITDGLRTGFTEVLDPLNADIAISMRFQGVIGAQGISFFDYPTSFPGTPFGVGLGASIHGQTGGRTGTTRELDLLLAYADIGFSGSGWNVNFNGVYSMGEVDDTAFRQGGASAQAGGFVHKQVEIWARYDGVFSDGTVRPEPLEPRPGTTNMNTVGVGVNYYVFPNSMAVRIQGDFQAVLNPQSTSLVQWWANSGMLPTDAGYQYIGRIQATLGF